MPVSINRLRAVGSSDESLKQLVTGIKSDLETARQSTMMALDHYHYAGDKLITAKELCPHGTWATWLKDNFSMTERTAERYILFAKSDVTTSDFNVRESLWRRINGNGSQRGRKPRSEESAPDPNEGRLTTFLTRRAAEVLDELKVILSLDDEEIVEQALVAYRSQQSQGGRGGAA